MQVKELLDTDDAVSPVIGVILMVAITVILAAVIATFVLGLGDQVSSTAPQASFTFEYDGSGGSGDLTVTHNGGDTIEAQKLYIRGAGIDKSWDKITHGDTPSYAATSEIAAGDYVEVPVNSDDTVRVVYQAIEGDTSATLGKWEGPEAS